MSDAAKGFWILVLTCVVWGLSGIYYKALSGVAPLEVLAHRTLWSMLFIALVQLAKGRLGLVAGALRSPVILVAAVMISINWFMFIWSVHNGKAIEASFGYYIFPLVAVLLGRIVLGERLSRAQWGAIGLATLGVAVLGVGLGVTPWISLVLAGTFGAYGLLKKRLSFGSATSVLGETILLAPVAIGVLWIYHGQEGRHFGDDLQTSAMLAFSGVMTGGPLMMFSYAAQRVRMATVGLVQYLNPTLQFATASFLFLEPVTPWHVAALALIWLAIALYTAVTLRFRR